MRLKRRIIFFFNVFLKKEGKIIDKIKIPLTTDKKFSGTIVHLSDLHFSNRYPKKRLEKIIQKIEKIKPKYICITGDLIDSPLESKENLDPFFSFLNNLATFAPCILILGYHDLLEKWAYGKEYQEYLKKLKQISGVYCLRNEMLSFQDVCFYGYEVEERKYHPENAYKEEVSKEILNTIKFPEDEKYHVLLLHSPNFLLGKQKKLKNCDLVLCGHNHDGLLFYPFTHTNWHFGVISPNKKLFPKNTRGWYPGKGEKPEFIINGGIIKLSKLSGPISAFNFLFPSILTEIIITNNKKSGKK